MKGHILIVEDEQGSAHLLAQHCTKRGFTPVIARNGAHGLHLYLTQPGFVGVFLDLCMPEVSGSEMLKILESMHRQNFLPERPRIVVVTAVSNHSKLDALTDHECVLGVVRKPIEKRSADCVFELLGYESSRAATGQSVATL